MIRTQPSATAQDSPGQSNHQSSGFIVHRRFREQLCSVGFDSSMTGPDGKPWFRNQLRRNVGIINEILRHLRGCAISQTAVAWVGESQMSARLTGGWGCSGMESSARLDPDNPDSGPAELGCCWGPARARGWLTEGSVLRLLILCFRFFSMVACME